MLPHFTYCLRILGFGKNLNKTFDGSLFFFQETFRIGVICRIPWEATLSQT